MVAFLLAPWSAVWTHRFLGLRGAQIRYLASFERQKRNSKSDANTLRNFRPGISHRQCDSKVLDAQYNAKGAIKALAQKLLILILTLIRYIYACIEIQ